MNIYISILRGINVSGKNMIKMETLRNMYSAIGFEHVESYIQSGNVVFTSELTNKPEIEKIISEKIKETFNADVPVLILSVADMEDAIRRNPYISDSEKDISFLHLTFLKNTPDTRLIENIDAEKYKPDEFSVFGNVVYLYCPNGYGNTKLSNTFFEKKLKTDATTRNWKSANELLKMTGKLYEKT